MPGTSETASRTREWDAASYHRVSEPQVQWGTKVLERLELRGDEAALDAGCGTGRLSKGLCAALPQGRVVGVDRSLAMASAATRILAPLNARVVAADLLTLPLSAASFDLVFSTATFHWILDHEALFTELARVLRPGGRLVAQCGGMGNIHGVHELTRLAAASPDLRHRFAGWRDPWCFADAETTVDRLGRAGFVDASAWLEDTPTYMPDRAACDEFLRTVILRPWLALLDDPAEQTRFVDHVLDGLAVAPRPWILDYRRLNLEARRPG